MFPLFSTLLGCPSRSFIGIGRNLTMTGHRVLSSFSPHPSQAVQLQMVTHSCLTFTLLSLKEACSCKPIATCVVVFLQGNRGSTGTEKKASPFPSLLCGGDKTGSQLWPVPEEAVLVNLVRARMMSFSFIAHMLLLARAVSGSFCARSMLPWCLRLIMLETKFRAGWTPDTELTKGAVMVSKPS